MGSDIKYSSALAADFELLDSLLLQKEKKKFKVADGGKKKEKKIKNPVFEGRHTELLMEV